MLCRTLNLQLAHSTFPGECQKIWHSPMGNLRYSYLPKGSTAIHSLLALGARRFWYYFMYRASKVAYVKPSSFCSKSWIFGIRDICLLSLLFNSLKFAEKKPSGLEM